MTVGQLIFFFAFSPFPSGRRHRLFMDRNSRHRRRQLSNKKRKKPNAHPRVHKYVRSALT